MQASVARDYIDGLSPERRQILEVLRAPVFRVAPDASETIRQGMPAYDVDDGELCLFASQKRHVSLYMNPTVVEAHKEELADLDLGKSCVRFRKLEQLPIETIEEMLRETLLLAQEGKADGEG